MQAVGRWPVCLGDQLDPDLPLFRSGNKTPDQVWMAEARLESAHEHPASEDGPSLRRHP